MSSKIMDGIYCNGDENVTSKQKRRTLSEPVLRMIPNYRKGKQNGTLYNLQILSLNEQPHLLLCGEHGISLYKWNNLLSYISKNATYTYTISITQEESYTPHVLSPLERSFCHDDNYTHAEINSMSYCTTSSTLYGASGDGFGCYKWNLERGGTPVGTFGRGVVKGQGGRRSRKEGTTTRRGHEGYLHSVKVIPDSNMVLTGGDDGALGIWNGKEEALIELLHVKSTMDRSDSTTIQTDHKDSMTTKWGNNSNLWVSSLDVDTAGNWAYVGGGANQSTLGAGGSRSLSLSSNRSSVSSGGSGSSSTIAKLLGSSVPSSTGGFVSLWNLHTRTLTSSYMTRETIQNICYKDGKSSLDKTSSSPQLVTVANEGVVSYWSTSKMERVGRSWLSTPSAYSVCFGNEGEMAVGGIGTTIDCFTDGLMHKSYNLDFV
mmetsp:Transcript_18581/g.23587  ORF Transcript_18581/g.23587 Transcript_18581/m.23587 type:complete len:431 (-) Transcript_18581:57-1349(-)